MLNSRNLLYRLCHSTMARKAGRSHLKAAKAGDREQFLSLSASYLDLAVTYFGATRSEPSPQREARVVELFRQLWENVNYAERLSDFEYMLARGLIENADSCGQITSVEPLVTKVRLLDPGVRFALLTHEFENWPLRWAALAMRTRANEVHRMLSEARCELCGINWESLSREEQSCLIAVSESLAKCPNLRDCKKLLERTRQFPRINAIKAQWLELRPELVEVRHRYLPSQELREQLLGKILGSILNAPARHVALMDRVVNSVHFSRHSRIRVS